MGVTTTKALILRHHDERERDRSVIVLTPDQGLLRLRARGTKSSVSKLAGSLEPLSEVTLSFADGRHSGLITGAILIDRFSGLRDDLVSLVAAQWLAELIEQVARPGQAIPELWDLVKRSWQLLIGQRDWSLGRRWLALDRMAWQILRLEGFTPALDHCPRCSQPMPADEIVYDPLIGFVHVHEAGVGGVRLSKKNDKLLNDRRIEW
jgi:DNA repair protein RecO